MAKLFFREPLAHWARVGPARSNGCRYYQEIALGIALDRAEYLDDKTTIDTPAGLFENCVLVGETTPLELDEFSLKAYARGVGMVQDDALRLVAYGPRSPVWFRSRGRGG